MDQVRGLQEIQEFSMRRTLASLLVIPLIPLLVGMGIMLLSCILRLIASFF